MKAFCDVELSMHDRSVRFLISVMRKGQTTNAYGELLEVF